MVLFGPQHVAFQYPDDVLPPNEGVLALEYPEGEPLDNLHIPLLSCFSGVLAQRLGYAPEAGGDVLLKYQRVQVRQVV